MLVKYWMRKDVVTVDINESMHQAVSLIKDHRTPMLPVLKDGVSRWNNNGSRFEEGLGL